MSMKAWLYVFVLTYAVLIGVLFEHTRSTVSPEEREKCQDTPDSEAYMARRPGEPHATEVCIHAQRLGAHSWVPDTGWPL